MAMDLMTRWKPYVHHRAMPYLGESTNLRFGAAVEESLLPALFMFAIAIETCRSTLAQ